MEQLNKWDMKYLVGCGAGVMWRNPKTREYEDYPFTKERLAFLDSLIVYDDDHHLSMDRGVNISLFVYKETEDGPMLAFYHGHNSEEGFYGDDYFNDAGPFEVTRKAVTTYEYSKVDGVLQY